MGSTAGPLEEIKQSLISTRELIRSLNDKYRNSPADFDTKDGISLLSLKYHVLLSYLRSLTLLTSQRVLGKSLSERSQPAAPFSDGERGERGHEAGDLVDSMIEGRLVLEKVKVLEGRMRYQIDKLVRVANEDENATTANVLNDPLAFRPNPQNLVNNGEDEADSDKEEEKDGDNNDGVYRPPRVAPMPYVPTSSSKDKKKSREPPQPKALKSLLYASDPAQPHMESVSGLGGPTASSQVESSRARYLKHLTEFEESQFGRVMLSKKEEKRRRRDEAILSMGGGLSGVGEDGSGGRRAMRAGGLEDEFMDVIKDTGSRGPRLGDGYEELRKRSKKAAILDRSRNSKKAAPDLSKDGLERKRKSSRFEMERKKVKKRKLQ